MKKPRRFINDLLAAFLTDSPHTATVKKLPSRPKEGISNSTYSKYVEVETNSGTALLILQQSEDSEVMLTFVPSGDQSVNVHVKVPDDCPVEYALEKLLLICDNKTF